MRGTGHWTLHADGRGERGSAIVEAAIILPILLVLLFGVIEFGRVFLTWHAVSGAAQEGARAATLDDATEDGVTSIVTRDLANYGVAQTPSVAVDLASQQLGAGVNAATVSVSVPFQFLVLSSLVPGMTASLNISSEAVTMREP